MLYWHGVSPSGSRAFGPFLVLLRQWQLIISLESRESNMYSLLFIYKSIFFLPIFCILIGFLLFRDRRQGRQGRQPFCFLFLMFPPAVILSCNIRKEMLYPDHPRSVGFYECLAVFCSLNCSWSCTGVFLQCHVSLLHQESPDCRLITHHFDPFC